MILPPQVGEAGAEHALLFREGAEVTVRSLGSQQVGHELLEMRSQVVILGDTEDLHGADEVLAGELPGPREQVAVGALIAIVEHGQHPRIGDRGREEPVLDDGVEVAPHGATEDHRRVAADLEYGFDLCRCRLFRYRHDTSGEGTHAPQSLRLGPVPAKDHSMTPLSAWTAVSSRYGGVQPLSQMRNAAREDGVIVRQARNA